MQRLFSRHASHRANPSRRGTAIAVEPHGTPLPLVAAVTNLIRARLMERKFAWLCLEWWAEEPDLTLSAKDGTDAT